MHRIVDAMRVLDVLFAKSLLTLMAMVDIFLMVKLSALIVRLIMKKNSYRLTKRGENVVGAVLALLAVLLAAVADRIAFMY